MTMKPFYIMIVLLILLSLMWGSGTKAQQRGLTTYSYTAMQNCVYVFEAPNYSLAAVTVVRTNVGSGPCSLESK